ncbi:hypothetical protein V1264_017369 [Littorina saxatilis]|uniref:Sulfatase N-terminal domain-containing protein n=2 Tax=Littorina saxatilis TaxID=31220 RepID=A0AAN9GFP9_9CAEN
MGYRVISPASLLLTSLVLAHGVTQAMTQKAPNVIMFLVDDMGFNDVSWRDERMHTPNLQRLRDDGVELNQLYMLPKCTASRAAIMTGRYPYKTGLQSNQVFRHCKNNTLPLHLKTLPQYMKDLGYSTHAVGKWHLGFCNLSATPTHRGFDSFYGSYMGSIDNYKLEFTKGEGGYDFHFNEVPHWASKGHYSTDLLTQRTQSILKEELSGGGGEKTSPVFIYLAYTAVHDPIQSPSRYIKHTKCSHIKDPYRRKYCGMVAAVDESVGNITSTINALGLEDEFLLLFASDNGGAWAHGASNWPLRGHKGTVFEGGTRVAAFIHGKKFLPRSPYAYNGLLHGVDIIPTLVGAAGGTVRDDMDGLNAWQQLQQNVSSGRTEIVYNLDTEGEMGAIRHMNATSDFKLVYDKYEKLDGGCAGWQGEPPGAPKRPAIVPCPDYMLFDLSVDPQENDDVSNKFPAVLKQLTDRYSQLKKEEVKKPYYQCMKMSKPHITGGAWTHGWC